MAQAAVNAMEEATTVEELTAALEAAAPFAEEVGVDIVIARERLERLRRYEKLARALVAGPVSPQRQTSHNQRSAMLTEARLKRALGMDTTDIDKRMKDHCYGDKGDGKRPFCLDCTEGPEYQSLCLHYLLECLRVRISTRLQFDQQNAYAIDPAVTQFMTRYSNDPLRTWLDETASLLTLPDRLDEQYAAVVQPTDDGTKLKRTEAKLYKSHMDSIRLVIESIGRCDAAVPKASEASGT